MEEESWLCVDEGFSSDESFSDSDKVDSETEAELYSLIHFEGNLSSLNCQSSVTKNCAESDETILLSDKTKYVLSTEAKERERETEFICDSDNFLQNGIDEFTGRENCDKTNVSDGSIMEAPNENEEIFSPDHLVPTNFGNNSNSDGLVRRLSPKKRKIDDSLQNYSSLPKKAATDSSRKIRLSNADSPGNEDIQTNLCGVEEDDEEVVFISSDSETDHSTPSKRRITQHQNMSMPNIKIGENSKDLWFVNQEDINRARNVKARRYHDKFEITCSNCNRQGHHNRICPLPKRMRCFICGGEHTSTNCMSRICGKCYKTGHDRMSCRISKIYFCKLCKMRGHTKQNCPDLWRRYHLTTQPGEIVPDKNFKQNSFVFCCKCGRPGHFGAVCYFEHQGYKNCFPTWPNVLSYDEPFNLPVQISNTPRNEPRKKRNTELTRQKKKILTEAEKLAQKKIKEDRKKQRIKKQKERKQLKLQENLNSQKEKESKVLKEKDFPRTPKNNSANNLSSPRTSNYNSKINLFSPKAEKNASSLNQLSFRSPKNNSATNLSSMTALEDDSIIILPTPKVKKNISFIDLASPKQQKNNHSLNDSSDLPESVRLMMMIQDRRKERNRRKKLRRRQRLKEKELSRNMST